MGRNYDFIALISNTFTLKRPRKASFTDVIKLQPCLLKQPFKT